MTITDLIDEAILEKTPVEPRKYGTVGPSPFLHRAKSLKGNSIKTSPFRSKAMSAYNAGHGTELVPDAEFRGPKRKRRGQ